MIKINLLPFRAARKKENIRRQISIYFLLVIFILTAIGYIYINVNSKYKKLTNEKISKTNELATYAQTTKRIKELETKQNQVKKKLDIIRGLEKQKRGPVQLLDEISIAVPKNKLWLTSLVEKGGILSLNGTAKDNDVVALFMTNLELSEHITSVDLSSTKLKTIQDYETDVVDFALSCKTYSFLEPPGKSPAKARRR
ncbi:MAG TPA: PilN domain-containing protein [Desulfobacteraceae bacterium]|nr:PilN domain-containing protein [Desulfobacteraceae bacterium]HPJ67430.1 PilN domain-containing protein [Desulfobacteraceae bacterium]HPQ29194.1 PilN domain-containing protein [Desulfobacteraceae bacterium]